MNVNLQEKNNEISKDTQKISQIDTQIQALEAKKWEFESQKDQVNESEIEKIISEIENISTKISTLKTQREDLMKDTQTHLQQTAPLNENQIASAQASLKDSWLSSEEQQKAKKSIESGKFNFLEKILDWSDNIFMVLLNIFSSIFQPSYNQEWDEQDENYTKREKLNPITEKERLEFIKEAKKHAQNIEAKYGIPWEVSLSQCILESWWGQSKLARKHGNYFWIKGKWVHMMTKEDYGKWLVKEEAEFRTYKNMEDSFEAYAQFLIKNPRYKNAFQYASNNISNTNHFPKEHKWRDALQFGIALWRAWYATDSKYDQKLASVMARIEKSDV